MHNVEEQTCMTTGEGIEEPTQQISVLPQGTALDRYVILDLIGQGGMGVVYKAYDPELDRRIAIKLLRVSAGGQQSPSGSSARLIREAQALAQLSHPNVIAVYDVGTYGQDVFVAMEMVEGINLKHWLGQQQPNRRQILDVLLSAGRGLEAAHKVGLIHRDFKPENVMVGEDGRVRVLDFGLARYDGQKREIGLKVDIQESQGGLDCSQRLLATPLTQIGLVTGTPYYMAPEQYVGRSIDARTDQFSFCVVLYEALYGRRPFSASEPEQLRQKVMAGEIDLPPAGTRVPRRLRKLIFRGLSVDPESRHKSMETLLFELARDVGAVRRRVVMVAGFVVVMALSFVWMGLLRNTDDPGAICRGGERYLTKVWDDDVRRVVRASFLATGRTHAAATYKHVDRALSTYAGQWVKLHREVCEATHVRGEQSDRMLDLRMSCLKGRLGSLGALTEVFSGALDREVVDRAAIAARKLPALDDCSDEQALTTTVPLPEDPTLRAKIEELEESLVRAEALESAGKFEECRELSKELVEQSNQVNYAPLQARVYKLRSEIQWHLGEYREEESSLHKAALFAAKAQNDRLAAEAWLELLRNLGYSQAYSQKALTFQPVAEAAVARAGDKDELKGVLYKNLGYVYEKRGQYADAYQYFAESLAILERVLPPDHPDLGYVVMWMSWELWRLGRHKEAYAHGEQALRIYERSLGPDHPRSGYMHMSLGLAAMGVGELVKAQFHHEQFLKKLETASGPDSYNSAAGALNLGLVLRERGQHKESQHLFHRALEIFKKKMRPDHPTVANTLCNIGVGLIMMGQYRKAQTYLKQGLAIYEKGYGIDYSERAMFLRYLGACYLGLGQPKKAITVLEQSVSILSSKPIDAFHLAHARFLLARAMLETQKDRKRAMELATEARTFFVKDGKRSKTLLAEVEVWLKERFRK